MLRLRQSLSLSSPSLCPAPTCTTIRSFSFYALNILKNLISSTNSYSLFSKIHSLRAFNMSQFSTSIQPFDKMPQRSLLSQNTHIQFVLDLLKFSNVRPDIITVVNVHCFTLKVGFLVNLPTSTSLLTAYSRTGDFGSSWDLFNETCNKDVIFWNAMITASVENKCFSMAMHFLVEMIEDGIGFDSTTLLIVVSALSFLNFLKQGGVIHGLSIKAGMLSDSNLCNALMDMYAKRGDLNSSECMFARMECRDIVSWNTIVSGCLHNGLPEKSLLYFREMICCSGKQVRPDNVSLSCAISACLGELSFGQVIHGLGIKLGYMDSSFISVANSLISLYSQCGDIQAAESVFCGMTDKDIISWNAMIDGFASNGKIVEAFDLLHEMQLMGSVQADTATVVSVIPLCAELMLLREGRSIHGYAVRRLLGYDILVMNSLMDFYSKCHNLTKAKLLFNTIPLKDLVSWNTMISGYSHNGHSKEAQTLFKEMLHFCSHTSLSTLLAILPSSDSPEFLKFGTQIHCWQLKLGFSNNILAVNSLMHMYINCGDLMASFSLLQKIFHIGDTSCWNTVIVACTHNGHLREALKTFNLMRQESNASHDSITLVNIISVCGILEQAFQGRSLHGLAVKSSMGPNTRVQNSLITMYSRCRDVESASLVFRLMSNHNLCSWNCMISAFSQNRAEMKAFDLFRCLPFEHNEFTIVSILSACTQLGVIRHGKQIYGHVYRFGLQENSFISAALVDMYSNCGRLDSACKIFENSREKSDAAWNSMISAFGYHGEGIKAIELFHEMCNSGIRPNKSTFVSLLSACSHSGLVDEGLWYYRHMLEEYEVEPVTEHHVCLVDMLGRSGKLHEAYEFIMSMPKQPEAGAWGAMLSACNYHGDTKMGKKVAEILFELEPENVGYYISLSNMYVACGRWKEAVEIREIILNRNLRKVAGYSLIDVGF
ncbi:hypothetical protein EZV62_017029 [Acer yangbiense]|uniref:Pentatricopeptide repeat-containing protein n=1 Tax=Acer yangbiense TaxID=1000413 RepID=A0A5C7HQ78_9ROSI|nr:hypothetical protein EZV62_017029 [Acer yangbiense]